MTNATNHPILSTTWSSASKSKRASVTRFWERLDETTSEALLREFVEVERASLLWPTRLAGEDDFSFEDRTERYRAALRRSNALRDQQVRDFREMRVCAIATYREGDDYVRAIFAAHDDAHTGPFARLTRARLDEWVREVLELDAADHARFAFDMGH